MALIKCPECGNDISDKAKKCPHCGHEKAIKYCPECGQMLDLEDKECSKCGYNFEELESAEVPSNGNGEYYGLSIAGLILSFTFSFLGLIFGIIALAANKGKTNTAKSLGLAATIISGIFLFIQLFFLFICLIGLSFAYYVY